MSMIPIGMLAGADGIDWIGFGRNLLAVTLGNIVGGASVAMAYRIVRLHAPRVTPFAR